MASNHSFIIPLFRFSVDGVHDMDYFVSESLSKLEEMIDKERNSAIKLRLLAVWHKKRGATEQQIKDILPVLRATVGFCIRRFRKDGFKRFQRKHGSGGHNRYLTKEQEKELKIN